MATILSRDLILARIAEYSNMTPGQREEQRVASYNRTAGAFDPKEYDCPKCLNRGNYMRLREDLSCYIEDCQCMAIRRSIWSAKAAGIYDRLLRCDFPSFQTDEPWEREMKNTALNWAKHGSDAWLLLCGQSGCGKTHLTLAAVGYRIFHRNQRVMFLDWRNFNMERECDKAKFAEHLENAKKAELLFIDDLLKLDKDRSYHPSAEKELAFQLINHRSNERKVTVISTELTPEQLLKMDEATGSRIQSGAAGHSYTVNRDARKNRRLRPHNKKPPCGGSACQKSPL